jgi:alpha-ketoglutarate-dependent taurine dioxygenase
MNTLQYLKSHDELFSAFSEKGIVLLKQVGTKDEFLTLTSKLGLPFHHHDADEKGVTVLKPDFSKKGASGADGFSQKALELHTDRSTIGTPPAIIAMLYHSNTGDGGDALYVDGNELYEKLRIEHRDVWNWATSQHAVQFNDGKSSYLGSIFEIMPNGQLRLRFRADDFGFFPNTRQPELQIFLKCIHSLEYVFRPKNGDVVIMDNWRWLHGRTTYRGEREVWRILIEEPLANCGLVTRSEEQRLVA